jgi:molybdopterin converting factor subunit 1
MTVLLFARARDVIGSDRILLAGPTPASVGELRRQLMQQYPRLAGLAERSAFAVNDEFADDEARIPSGAEIALLPPVSGG